MLQRAGRPDGIDGHAANGISGGGGDGHLVYCSMAGFITAHSESELSGPEVIDLSLYTVFSEY
jgi:hypothetical protein